MGGSLRSYISIIAIKLDIIKIVARSQVSKPLEASPTFARSASTRGGDSQRPALLHRLPQSRSRTYLFYKVVQWSWQHHEPSFSSRFVSAMTIAMKALPCEAIKCHPPGKEPTEAAYTTAKSTRGGDEPPTTTTDLRSPQHNEDQRRRQRHQL